MSILRTILASGATLLLAACQTTGSTGNYTSLVTEAAVVARVAMPVGQETVAPFGYISFCQRNPADCELGVSGNAPSFELTEARWLELNEVNNHVNRSVRPVEDYALHKRVEWWSYPTDGAGDCEDYVLLKRKLLIERGWPAEALLISVVKEWSGAGHAVLLAVTDKGEFVLDNQSWSITEWQDAPYTWVKRQSTTHPHIWVNLDRRTFTTTASNDNGTPKKSAAAQNPPAPMLKTAQTTSVAAN